MGIKIIVQFSKDEWPNLDTWAIVCESETYEFVDVLEKLANDNHIILKPGDYIYIDNAFDKECIIEAGQKGVEKFRASSTVIVHQVEWQFDIHESKVTLFVKPSQL